MSSSSTPSGGKGGHRWKPGTVAKRQIQKLQTGTESNRYLLPKAVFQRYVRGGRKDKYAPFQEGIAPGILYKGKLEDPGFQEAALLVLQESAEHYLVSMMRDAAMLAAKQQRMTVTPKDVATVCQIRGDLLCTASAT